MDRKEAHWKFCSQRSGARARGIEWHLTFDEWLAWWGNDLDRRGIGHDDLQMQRFHDKGPYALGNIKKGLPVDNAKTAANCWRHKSQERLAVKHQAALDALPVAVDEQEELTEDERELRAMFSSRISAHWMRHYTDESV